jgi:ABC-2 type transport system permease protein
MNKVLNRYIPFAKAGMKGFLAYKAQVFLWLFISLIEVLFVVFLYHAIYNSSSDPSGLINGFTFNELILYMVTSFVLTFTIGNNDTSWNIFEDIREGTISSTLTKPVSYRLRHLFTCFGSAGLSVVLFLLPILVILYGCFIGFGLIAVTWTYIFDVIILLVLMFLAMVLIDSISYLIGLLTFYTEHMFGLSMIKNAIQDFLSGKMLPLSYMGAFGVFCSYTPFAFLNSAPVMVLMGKVAVVDGVIYVAIALAWVTVIELINHFMFGHCIKKLTVQGG